MMQQSNSLDVSIKKIDSRIFLTIGNESIEIDAYKIVSSSDGDTELTINLKRNVPIFELSANLRE
ncbi:MAG: hypothetical protein ACLUFC_04995 [Anaerobutyricum hallii]|uniref:hypothetical protein n=1 Tax=Anaerobutyricum hallii TaxID=39488 RepID=UPI00399483B7